MGRGSIGVRRMVCLVLAAVALVAFSAGCKPLYGNKPEKLKNPERKKRPPEAPEAVVQIKDIDECSANFRDDPKLHRPDKAAANQLVGEGDAAMQQSGKAKDAAAQAELIKASIDKYRNALVKDNYHQEATLKLALAYDTVYRKGCALLMLKRLAALQANPKYAKAANARADEVMDNTQWFKRYRNDAVSAVGR